METGPPTRKSLTISDLLKPHSKLLALGLIAVIGEAVTNLLEPWPLKIVLDNVLKSRQIGGWLNPLILAKVGNDKIAILKFAAVSVLIIAVVGAICSYAEKLITTTVGQWVMHDLRRTVYHRIQQLSLAYHDNKRTGDLISRVTSDIDAIQSFITSGLLSTLINSITLIGMVSVMFYINWRFTLIALSIAPLLFIVVYTYTRRIKKAAREVRKKEGEIVSVIQEVLSSIRVAKLSPMVDIIVACGTALVLWFGARMALDGTLSAGSLVTFIWYLGKMYKPMQELSKMTDAYSKATVGYDRIREVLDTQGEVRDMAGARTAPRFKGKIELEKVTFGYDPQHPVLKELSLRIEPSQVVALVGPTGAGKTTLIGLIPRFYDPISGAVKIDGYDIRTFKQKSLRQQISFVLQETVLFHGTIWNNIAYGKPEATRGEIFRAAELSNSHEFIEKLPEGYNTIVGERGATLSGGQRQRIAIARAIIRDTPILIMDEPSSGLDAASEKLVFDALDRLMGAEGKTSMVIAHRLSTIRRADVIFVLNNGVIAESGKHDELLKSGGLYSELYELQFRREEDPESVSFVEPVASNTQPV